MCGTYLRLGRIWSLAASVPLQGTSLDAWPLMQLLCPLLILFLKYMEETSVVVQWLKIYLPMQRMWVNP